MKKHCVNMSLGTYKSTVYEYLSAYILDCKKYCFLEKKFCHIKVLLHNYFPCV